MSIDAAVAVLGTLLLASGLATLPVLLLRRPVRAWLGARAAYALWWCVPAAMLAVALPARRVAMEAVPSGMVRLQAVPIMQAPAALIDAQGWLAAAWLLGAASMAGMLLRRQRRFLRGLGRLTPGAGNLVFAAAGAGLPVALGLWRPRIVLPHDFADRFAPDEQRLVIAHERVHLRRGDLWAHALAVLVLCLHWFNPMVHYALRLFRLDQELACDAVVIARAPGARKAYGNALLKTRLAGIHAPLGCHWPARHPLKERIVMLKRRTPGRFLAVASLVPVIGVALSTGYAAWAQQPARVARTAVQQERYRVSVQLDMEGRRKTFAIEENAGVPFSLHSAEGKVDWRAEFTLMPMAGGGQVRLAGRIEAGGRVVGEPVLVFALGENAGLRVVDPKEGSVLGLRIEVAPVRTAASAAATRDARRASDALLPAPRYPLEALRKNLSGKVVLLVDVDAHGVPVHMQVESSEPAGVFERTVLETAAKWRFTPAMQSGRPIAGRVRVPVTFETEMEPVAAPQGYAEEDYAWYRLGWDGPVGKRVCDILLADSAQAGASPLCGIGQVARR